ncbi:hypothetical protein U9M48_013781 [Paspalum notatum var. saurae]|uniref:Uncharacterized protein n=1 Tax=Paspalum notatum var. saurae TaxID=547442 RepID=A0AAQ3WJX0_PASNO
MESLRQEIQRHDAFLKAQEEYQRQQQLMFQQQGLMFVMPEVRPSPVPPQWGMFAQMPFSPTAQGPDNMDLRMWMSFVNAIEIENVDGL